MMESFQKKVFPKGGWLAYENLTPVDYFFMRV
jgi:hypothetical protein